MLGSIYAMVGVALTLSIGLLKFLNFSIPGLFMLGGMTTWVLINHGAPWPLAVVGALVIGALGSLLVERFTWRWMRNAQEFVPLVSSMAFLILFENLAVSIWGSELHSVPPVFGGSDWRIGGLVVSLPQLFGLFCSVALIWGLSLLLTRTRVGRALRTIAEDSDTALLLGVDVHRIVPLVFVISGLFAALAGVLFAINYRQVHPFMGEVLGL
jgi:branched-chain amino acid transport system permease protein